MPIRFPVPTLILVFGVIWMSYGAPVRLSEILSYYEGFLPTKPVVFEEMEPGDVVTGRYKSVGCYHRTTARLTFRRTDDGSIQLSVYAQNGGPFVEFGVLRRELSASEVAALDTVLQVYRSSEDAGLCTTVTALQLLLYRNGKQLAASDRVTDRYCVVPGFEHLVYEALDAGLW